MPTFRKLTIRLRKVPRFVWRLSIAGCMMATSALAWWYPLSHAWLATQLGVATASPQVADAAAPTSALADRVTALEQKVAEAEQAVADDTTKMATLQSDFQTATNEVAASNTTLQQQTAEIENLTKQLQGVQVASSSPDTPSSAAPQGKVSINTGSAAQLDTLPGIGPTYAQRIIDYRTAHGLFKTIDDLTNVTGIGPATLDKIRDLIEL